MAVVQMRDLRKTYGAHEVIHGVTLDIAEGEFVVFVGPSGCGKSTMLRMIAGLEDITSGQLLIDGVEMNQATPVQRGIAMVFQNYALYPNMTVFQNMAFGLEQQRMPRSEIAARVNDAARTLKIEHLLERRPKQLSGGQSQRVAIGRCIVRNPRIFLFDEPLSNLDAELRVHMRIEIASLHKRIGRTTIYVTHDQVEAMTLADKIVVFNEGGIVQAGSPLELYNHPVNKFVAGFLGSPKMNFIETDIIETATGTSAAQLGGGQVAMTSIRGTPAGARVILGLRPEDVELRDPGDDTPSATVLFSEQLGGETFLHCEIQGRPGSEPSRITLKRPGQLQSQAGQRVNLSIAPERLYCFDTNTEVAIGPD
jgi:multiple sugar transport system ATP-binding protein